MREKKRKYEKKSRKRARFLPLVLVFLFAVGLIFYAIQPGSFRGLKNEVRARLYWRDFDGQDSYNAKSMVLVDRSSGQVYASKAEDEKQCPASLAKLFTIEYARNFADLETKIKVKKDPLAHVKKGSSLAQLQPGEVYTLEDLFAAMLVPSGNDAAYVLADYIGGLNHPDARNAGDRIALFLDDLNKHLQKKGWTDTLLLDPSGYDFEGTTTAQDLKGVCDLLLEENWFRTIVAQANYEVKLRDGSSKSWKNTNKLLNPKESAYYNERVKGIKTGSLGEDYNLIVLYKTEKKEFLIISLGSSSDSSRYDDLSYLLNTIDKSFYLNK